MKIPKLLSGRALNATVFRLGLVSLFADVSSEMLYPITPLFLTTVLGASMASVGLIEGCAEGVASLLKTFAGSWSDASGRRKVFVWTGYLLAALAKPLTGLAGNWSHVLFARSLDRVGKGLRTGPRDALIADSVDVHNRGAAFGWHRLMDTLGAVIGPLLAILYLRKYSTDLRTIFLLALVPGLIAVLIALTISETEKTADKIKKKPDFNWGKLSGPFKTYLFGWMVFSLANSSDVFLLLKAKQAGLGMGGVILLYCLYNLTYALLSPVLGGLSDVIGRRKCLIGGLGVFALVYLGFSVASSTLHFAGLFAIYGIYMAATDGVGKAFAIELLPPDRKATAIGVLGTVVGLSTIFASTFAGFLWDKVSPQATFLFGSAGAVFALLVFCFFMKEPTAAV